VNEQQAPLANGTRGMKLSRAGRRLTRVMTGSHSRLLSAAGGRVLGRYCYAVLVRVGPA
jgi:hypothetical protein